MRNVIINGLISFSVALFVVSIINYFVSIPSQINLHDVKMVLVNDAISQSINIQDKEIASKTVNNTNYLNTWKLSATIVGKDSVAMVLKGRISKILKLKDELEGYEVKNIQKEKVLFSNKTDDIWLSIKSNKITTNQSVSKVVSKVEKYQIKRRVFQKNIGQPERLLNTINIIPEMINNNFQGMKVVSLLEGSFLYLYGLRKDDIIKKINGKSLLSLSDGISAYQNILRSNTFTISILRDNNIEEFKYDVK